jgi:hypothetical protein
MTTKRTGDIEEPELLLWGLQDQWERTRNPYFAWSAAELCGQYKKEFPRWVIDYFIDCAQRMFSDEAALSTDFRKVLPSVLGFPPKKKDGPGHPLRPLGQPEYFRAISVFAGDIENGAEPADALRNAALALDQGLMEVDDKTLQTHIKKYYGVTKAPSTNAEWSKVIETRRKDYLLYIIQLVEKYYTGPEPNPTKRRNLGK